MVDFPDQQWRRELLSTDTSVQPRHAFMPRLASLPLALLLLAIIPIGSSTSVFAQAFFQMGQQANAGRLIEPPRVAMQQLRDAERAAEQRRFSEAVVILGDLLQRLPAVDDDDELSGQDFFLESGTGGDSRPTPERADPRSGRPQSSRSGPAINRTLVGEARRMLSELPATAIETYELRYGVEARQLLERSASTRDWAGVAEVRRRFFHTEAGRDAVELLARRAISLGQPLTAVRLLEAVRTHPTLSASQRERVDELMVRMRRVASGPDHLGSLRMTPQPGDEPGSDETPDRDDVRAASADDPVEVANRRTEPMATDYRMLGDRPDRREPAAGQLPLSIPRWIARTVATPSQERLLDQASEAMTSSGEVAPPAWVPIKVGGQVVMRSTERLFGVDFETGRLIWQFPWFDVSATAEQTDEQAILMEEDAGESLLKQRVWNDLPYGRVTSDGKRVFLLDNLSEVEVTSLNPLMGFQGTRPTESISNSLVALDLATEGKILWQIGGRGDQTDGWGEIFFLGAPLPLDDALYVMAEISGDIVLICLDAATGLERWRQQLLAVESGRVNSDPIRRIAGATPAYQDGLLICSTGAGAVVAVDLADQSLAWAMLLDRNEAINQNMLGRRDGLSAEQLLKRWWDGTPKIVGDTVYVTPIETDRLYALDLLTGEKRWKEIARQQKGARYLAGVHHGLIVLVGNDQLRGIDNRSGENRWESAADWLDSGEQVAGVGVFGDQVDPASGEPVACYFVPTTSNRIVAVSLVDGTPLAYRETQFPTGNLIAVDGQILSQSPTSLSVAHGQQTLEPLVAAALQSDPADYQAIVRKAELLLQQGELAESLNWLAKARELDPEDLEVENLSVRAMLLALKEDFSANVDLLPRLDRLIDRLNDRIELIKLQVRAAVEAGQPVDAARRLIELSGLIARDASLAVPNRWSFDDPGRQVGLDAWLAARVSEVMEIADQAERDSINRRVAEHLASYVGVANPLARRLMTHFGRLDGAGELTRSLLQRQLEDGQYLAAERLALAASGATTGHLKRLADWQLEALAEAYIRGGLIRDGLAMLEPIDQTAAGDSGRLIESLELPAESLAALTESRQRTKWGSQVEVRVPQETLRVRSNQIGKATVGKTRRVVGQTFRGWQVVSDGSSPFGIRDPFGVVYSIPLDGVNRREETTRQAAFSGGLMIAMVGNELVGVNLFEVLRGQIDSVIWRRPWRTEGSGGIKPRSESTKFGDQIYRYVVNGAGVDMAAAELVLGPIVGDSFYVLQGGELIAYDALTAEPRWRNLDTPRGGSIVCDGDVVAIASPASGAIVQYDCRDGRKLSETPFEGYQIWASTDRSLLAYRELPEGGRDLVLLDPIADEVLLRHTFENVWSASRVFGRVIDGAYVVTFAASGEVLIWDLENATQIAKQTLDPIPTLKGLQVIVRDDLAILLPNTGDSGDDRSGVALHTRSGQDHVAVDEVVTAISLTDGEPLWRLPLKSGQWGCTLTQAHGSPLLMFARSKSEYVSTGSRNKSLDVMAVDTRDASVTQTLDQPIEPFNNDIETVVAVQPEQQRVAVSVGNLQLSYEFSDPSEDVEAP